MNDVVSVEFTRRELEYVLNVMATVHSEQTGLKRHEELAQSNLFYAAGNALHCELIERIQDRLEPATEEAA